MPDNQATPLWRKIVAAILDFLMIFFVAGYAIAAMTGNLTSDGFSLNGVPALITMAIIALYFVIGNKYLGGTVWKRLLWK